MHPVGDTAGVDFGVEIGEEGGGPSGWDEHGEVYGLFEVQALDGEGWAALLERWSWGGGGDEGVGRDGGGCWCEKSGDEGDQGGKDTEYAHCCG